MKLSDVMSASGLSMYAIVALVLFVVAFLAIVIHTFAPRNAAGFARDARLPLEDEPTEPATRARS